MDKEIMDKVNEMMKASGRRELSMDEMDQVVGGADAHDVWINGKYYTEGDIYNLFKNITELYGFDIAFDTFCAFTGFSQNEKPKSGSDWDMMSTVLCQYWKVQGRLQETGHSY